MSRTFKPGFKIGILGGGQLARMLALSAHNLGAIPYILSESEDDPAQQVVERGFLGKLSDSSAVGLFASHVDVLTFESEFIDCHVLEDAIDNPVQKIFPSLNAIRTLQDRNSQKALLDQNKIPTAEWMAITDDESVFAASEKFKMPFVIKKRRNGYDGYGTYILKNRKQLMDFVKNHLQHPDGFIAEKFIPYSRELACIFSRDKQGNILQFPLVESVQKEARCFSVKGPIKHSQFDKWSLRFKSLLKKIDYVGTIGVELFDADGTLLVNELAPRVHNTGHYSMNALPMSQFDAHIRAVCGLDLPTTTPKHSGFAMINLLGSKNIKEPSWTLPTDTFVHWYGKKENRAGRKMGHINALSTSPDAALKSALRALKGFKV